MHFYLENVDYLVRRRLRDLRQICLIQDYVKMFTTIMSDIRDITKKDKLFFFLDSLLHDVVMEFERRRV